MTVFALSWGTTALGYSRQKFLVMQLFGIVFLRDYHSGRRRSGRARPPAHAALGHRGDRRVRPGDGADVSRRNHRRGC